MIKNTKKYILGTLWLFFFLAPAGIFAQSTAATPLENVVDVILTVIEDLLPAASALVMVYFFYGLAKYALSSGDETKAKQGKGIMTYGLFAVFIMLSLSGIVYFLQRTLFIDSGPLVAPTIVLPSVE